MDREKVIYSIERCICHVPDACRDCAYDAGHPYNECVELLLKDALSLLKEQDKPTRPIYNGRYWECERCGEKYKDILAVKEYKHCPGCGRRIEWQG